MDCKRIKLDKGEDNFNLEDFPPEVLCKMFEYLRKEDLISMSRVSKKLREIAQEPKLWKHIRIDPWKLSLACVKSLSEFCPLLETLSFRREDRLSSSVNNTEMIQLFAHCKVLKQLDFEHLNVNDEVAKCVASSFRHLTTLRVHNGKHLTIRGLTHLATLDSLDTLYLEFSCHELPPQALNIIANNFPDLQRLHITGFFSTPEEGLISILDAHKDKLKELWVNCSSLTEASFSKIADCDVLEELNLNEAYGLTDAGLVSLQKIQNLETLVLEHTENVTKEGLLSFFENAALSELNYLELYYVETLDDRGLIAITKRCPKLRNLSIRWSPLLTEGGISHILENCKKLDYLEINAYQIPLSALLSIPEKLPTLRTLILWNAFHITDANLDTLKELAPRLKIKDEYEGDFDILHSIETEEEME